MFTKLKNLLKKSQKEENQDDNLGCIAYNLLRSGEIQVKINLKDLETDSIEKFANMFAQVTSLALSGYTIQLTKQLFMEADEEKYVQMMLFAAEECERIVEQNLDQSTLENEYIKPSEMFNE
jgi:hypothetical protein